MSLLNDQVPQSFADSPAKGPIVSTVSLYLTHTNFPSACITSILRTHYTWKLVQSPDISYNGVRMGMWTYAELSSGIVISCLPVIPKFFQHVGPKLSSALLTTFKFPKSNKSPSSSVSAGAKSNSKDENKALNDEKKLKLPRFKHTFFSSSVVSHHTEKEDDSGGWELYGQHQHPVPLKREEYALLDEEKTLPRSDDATTTKELGQIITPLKFATMRDGLERGVGVGAF